MKQKLLLKTMLLLCALVVGSSSVWAAEGDTHDFSQSISQVLNNSASISAINIDAQTYPVKKVIVHYRYNKTFENPVTVAVSVNGTSWGSKNIVGTGSNYTNLEFEGNTTIGEVNINFTNNLTASTGCGTFYVDKVTLVEGVSDSRIAIATIGNLSPMEIPFNDSGNFTLGVTPAADGYTISYVSEDDDVLYIEGDEYIAGTIKGTVKVTATVTPTNLVTYKPVSKDFNVTIYNPNAGDGTEARPYSVAEAIENTPSSGTSDKVYIKGNVSSFYDTSVMDDGTNYRYYISDDDGTTNELLVYRGKNIGNVAFTQASDLAIGDVVVIYGGLTTYSNTKEIAANNYIVSLNGKKLAGISYATTSYNTLPANDSFVTPTLTNPNNVIVTYSSDNTSVAEVDASTGTVTIGNAVGTATITATFAGNDSFLAATASYTITTARADANISFSETSLTLTQGDEFTTPTFNNPNNLTGIVFTSTYDAVVTISDAGVISLGNSTGTAIIKATYAQSVQYNAGEATCTITVNPSGVTPEPSATGYYEKVSSDSEVTTGNYLIVSDDNSVAFKTSLSSLDVTSNYISVDITDNIIEVDETTEANEVYIDVTDNSIKAANGKYIGRTTAKSNGLTLYDSPQAHSISISNGNATVTCQGTDNTTMYLKYNSDTNQKRFRYFTSSGTIQLYKKVAGQSPSSIDVYVSAAGFATYASNFDLDYAGSGLVAYKAVEDNGDIKFEEVTKVPAGAGVLLRASDGGGQNYAVSTTTSSETEDMEGNKFVRGTGAAVASNDGEGNYNYILNVVNNEIGFYRAAGNTVASNRAYIHTTINPTSGAIQFNFDEATGIRSVDNGQLTMDNEIYNLNGQRVAQPTKGLYILNGKKVIIK